jgi:tetratricopeptide (TPR) repeat protein
MYAISLWEQMRYRLGHHYVRLMGDIDCMYQQGGAASIQALASFREEWEQIRVLWNNLLLNDDWESGAICTELAAAAENCLMLCVTPTDYIALLESTLRHTHAATPQQHLSILYQLGEAYHAVGDNPKARSYFDQAFMLALAHDDKRYINCINNGIAQQLYRISQLEESISHSQRVLDAASGANDNERADALRCTGRCLLELMHYDQAKTLFEEAAHYYQQADNLLGIARVYNNLAMVAMYTADSSGARHYLSQSLSIGQKLQHYNLIADVMNTQGILARRSGYLDEAMYYYQRALELNETTKNRFGYSQILNNMGTIMFHQKQYDRAIHYFEQSLAIRLSINARSGAGSSVGNLCQTMNQQGNYRATLACLYHNLGLVRSLEAEVKVVARTIAHATRALSELQSSDVCAIAQLVGFVRANQHLDNEIVSFIDPAESNLRREINETDYLECCTKGESLTFADALTLLEPLVAAALSDSKK